MKKILSQLSNFRLFPGSEEFLLPSLHLGGVGCISVTANVAAKLCSEFQNSSLSKNNSNLLAKANEINEKLIPLHKSLFIESSPSPVKYAASLLKLCSDEVRLPLVKITEKTKKSVESAMVHANII